MGGKNGVYVSDAADPATGGAGSRSPARWATPGQKCTATSLLFVHERAADAVREELVPPGRGARRRRPARRAGTVVGPLIDAGHARRGRSSSSPARRCCSAARRRRPRRFLAPTLLTGDAPDQPRGAVRARALRAAGRRRRRGARRGCDALDYGLVAGIVSPLRDEVEHFARARRGRHRPRQRADRGRRAARAVRRRQELELRPARAGPRRPRVLLRDAHDLRL